MIWDPPDLPIDGPWREDGPKLAVEFTRKSSDGRITLVITPGADLIPVLWTRLAVSTAEQGRRALASRENSQAIGVAFMNAAPTTELKELCAWAQSRQVSHVIWTALPPRDLAGIRGAVPSVDDVVQYLRQLRPETRVLAERYVRRAPRLIRTKYRRAIERELGWTPVDC